MIRIISPTKLRTIIPGFMYDHYDSNLNIRLGSIA